MSTLNDTPSGLSTPSRPVRIGNIQCGSNDAMTLIAGPCVIESLDLCLQIAERVSQACQELGIGYVATTGDA